MDAYNSLMDTYATAPAPGPPPADPHMAASMGPTPDQLGPHISALQGTPPLNGDHNIPLHVGFLGLVALFLVVALRLLGFSFSTVGTFSVGG